VVPVVDGAAEVDGAEDPDEQAAASTATAPSRTAARVRVRVRVRGRSGGAWRRVSMAEF